MLLKKVIGNPNPRAAGQSSICFLVCCVLCLHQSYGFTIRWQFWHHRSRNHRISWAVRGPQGSSLTPSPVKDAPRNHPMCLRVLSKCALSSGCSVPGFVWESEGFACLPLVLLFFCRFAPFVLFNVASTGGYLCRVKKWYAVSGQVL